MPQIQIYLDETENSRVEQLSVDWNVSKVDVIKRLIRNSF